MPFIKGQVANPTGRPIGSKNKHTIRIELEDWFGDAVEGIHQEGWDNPLTIIARIANDDRNPPDLILKAAFKLADLLIPQLPKELIVTTQEAPMDPELLQLRLAQIYLLLQQQPVITDERIVDVQ